ncbi:MAG: RloB family protein [Candidatus Methylacidiphilaceae bacterium]
MSPGRRRISRALGKLPYRKLYVIAAEGEKTERQYFDLFKHLFKDEQPLIVVKCLPGGCKSAPSQVLKRMERFLRQEKLRSSDEAWLVTDKDRWDDEKLAQLHQWAQKCRGSRGFALSNPKFEYWLLLHFENGKGVASASDCINRLSRHLPDYDKGISRSRFTKERIRDAIRRAKERDKPPCEDWPKSVGTTVYRLVESLLRDLVA